MGGLIILTGLLTSVLMWGDLKNIYVIFSLFIAISFGILEHMMIIKKLNLEIHQGFHQK